MSKQRRSFWRVCRVYFRRVRITLWLVILLLLGVLIYFNQVGLPDFLKKPLLQELRARGLDLQFTRLRLSWFRGLIAENAQLGRPDDPTSPHLTVKQVQLGFDDHALLRLRFQLNSVWLRQGKLVLPVQETNEAPRALAIDDIQTYLRFLPDDKWSLDQFTATFAGVKFELSGVITNASAVSGWKFFQTKPEQPGGARRNNLRRLSDALAATHFAGSPSVRVDIRGDARDLTSFSARLFIDAPGADTPWGELTGGHFSCRISPGDSNGVYRADLSLDGTEAKTRWARGLNFQLTGHFAGSPFETTLSEGDFNLCALRAQAEWGTATNVQIRLHFVPVAGETNMVNAELTSRAQQIGTRWAGGSNIVFSARWIHALTNPIPLAGESQFRCDAADSQWGKAREIHLASRLILPSHDTPPPAEPAWGFWSKLAPYALDWNCRMVGPEITNASAEEITCDGYWRAPLLTVTNFQIRVGQEALRVDARLDVASRALQLKLSSNIDPHWVEPLFQPELQVWLAKCSWSVPPTLNLEAVFTTPPWVNPGPRWHQTMLDSMQLAGEFNFAHGGAFEAVSFSSAHSHFACSNLFLSVPDLSVTRPEGRIDAAIAAEHSTQAFDLNLRSTVDPNFLRPLFPANKQEAFNLFTFTQPPRLEVEVHGRGQDPDRLGGKGTVAITNFTFRGETVAGVQAALHYTNRSLLISNPRLQRSVGELTADAVVADFRAQKVYITNGFSSTDPMVVARAIGKHVARAVEPYTFSNPPIAHVYGTAPMRGEDDADLYFELDGGPFHWWQFNVEHVSGKVHWQGQRLDLKEMRMDFYGGQAGGFARFDFHPGADTGYQFAINVTNVVLRSLMRDLLPQGSKLDGALNGSLVIARADTSSIHTWWGYGNVDLRDGLIWDTPIFGVFSSVLNGLSPGLGSSRASAATGNFSITNSVVKSDDLEIRSTGMRLQYKGTVDFDGRVNAKVEANLLRDVWLVGPVVSTVFWPVTKLFEYRVGGTLGEPKAEPVFLIPKVVLAPFQMPFHPLRTLKGLLPDDSSRTNSPLPSPKASSP
jgi:hypothetical protein